MKAQSKHKAVHIYPPGVWWIYLGLALITLAAFQQLRICDFVNYDDGEYVVGNGNVNTGLTINNVIWAFTSGYACNWHPLTWLSHMLDCQLFDLKPQWHHFTNLLLHIINTLLLFAVFKQMTAAVWRSAFVAAAFALHPLHVGSVAWIAERKDVLSTLFWMLTMAAYCKYAKTTSLKWYLLTLAAFALGLMAKPMLVTLPFVLLLLDYWPLERINQKRKIIIEKLPFFVLSAVSSDITFLVQQKSGAVEQMIKIPLHSRIINALVSYLAYIEKMIWPSGLTVFYPHPRQTLPVWHAVVAAVLLAGVSIAIFRLARNHKYLVVGWLWYLGTLIPVIGIVQVGDQAMADRYTYIPLTGLFIIIAWGVEDLTRKWRRRKPLLEAIGGIIVAAMLICTNFQLKYWHNDFTLFEHALNVTKDNYLAHNNLGFALSSAGNINEAIKHYQAAIEIRPDIAMAHYNFGNALKSQGRLDEAIAQYQQALQIRPDYASAYNNLGGAFHQAGKLDEAISQFQRAIQLQPDYAEAYNNLGIVFLSQRKYDEALKYFHKTLRLKPDFFETYNNMGVALAGLEKFDEAIESFQRALKMKPDYGSAQRNLAGVIKLREEFKKKKPAD